MDPDPGRFLPPQRVRAGFERPSNPPDQNDANSGPSLSATHPVVASLSSAAAEKKDEPLVPRRRQPPPPPPRLRPRLAAPPSGRPRISPSRPLLLVRALPRRGRSKSSWPAPEIALHVRPRIRRWSPRAGRRSHRGRARRSLLARLRVRHSHPAEPHPTESEQKISPHIVRVAFHGFLADLQLITLILE